APDPVPARRIGPVVGEPRAQDAPGLQPHASCQLVDERLLTLDEVRARFGVPARLEHAAYGVNTAAHAGARFQHGDTRAVVLEPARGGKAGEPGADDDDRAAAERHGVQDNGTAGFGLKAETSRVQLADDRDPPR